MIIDELITLLGFKTDGSADTEAKNYNKALGSMTDAAAKLALGVIAAQVAVTAFVISFSSSTDEAGKFADSIGIGFEALQELEFAAKIAGGSAQELRSDLALLTEQFGGMGTADQVLLDLADKMKDLNKIEQFQLGKQMGLSEGTIRLLAEGRAGIEKLRKEAHTLGSVLSEEVAKDAAKAQDSLLSMNAAISGVTGGIAAALLPTLIKATEGITSFVVANNEIIKSSVVTVITGMSKGFGIVADAVSFVFKKLSLLSDLLPDFTGELDASEPIALAVSAALFILGGRAGWSAAKFTLLKVEMIIVNGLMLITSSRARIAAVATLAMGAAAIFTTGGFSALAVAAWAALAPILLFLAPVIAAVAAFVLFAIIMEDVWSSLTTGKGAFADLGKAIGGSIYDGVQAAKVFFSDLGDSISNWSSEQIEKFKKFVDDIVAWFSGLPSKIGKILDDITTIEFDFDFPDLPSWLGGDKKIEVDTGDNPNKQSDPLVNKQSGSLDAIRKLINSLDDFSTKNLDLDKLKQVASASTQTQTAQIPANVVNSTANTIANSNSTSNKDLTVNISGAGNPKAIAKEVMQLSGFNAPLMSFPTGGG